MNVLRTGRECTKCGEYKPWSSFSKQKQGRNGHSSRCKVCCRKYFKKRYRNGGYEKGLEYQRNNVDMVKRHIEKYQSKMRGGVYQVYTEQGRYIGQSMKMEGRVWNHKPWNIESPVNTKVLKWEVLEYIEDPVLRLERERYYIDTLKPELNER